MEIVFGANTGTAAQWEGGRQREIGVLGSIELARKSDGRTAVMTRAERAIDDEDAEPRMATRLLGTLC
jgi:hypothetical protein